ncbi:hypothetical protein GEMRC1_008275 [Eukaryota sp. GEM-RC1]
MTLHTEEIITVSSQPIDTPSTCSLKLAPLLPLSDVVSQPFLLLDDPSFTYTIGRNVDCSLCIKDPSCTISRVHCKIRFCHGSWKIFDKSLNGILVNAQKVKSSVLQLGCILTLGAGTQDYDDEEIVSFLTPPSRTKRLNSSPKQNKKQPRLVDEIDSDCGDSSSSKVVQASSVPPIDLPHSRARCSICLEIFADPLTVNCGHSFCSVCILVCLIQSQSQRPSCPLCRTEITSTPARARDLSDMINDFIKPCLPLEEQQMLEQRLEDAASLKLCKMVRRSVLKYQRCMKCVECWEPIKDPIFLEVAKNSYSHFACIYKSSICEQ